MLRACPTDQFSFNSTAGLCRSGGFHASRYRVVTSFRFQVTRLHASRFRLFQICFKLRVTGFKLQGYMLRVTGGLPDRPVYFLD